MFYFYFTVFVFFINICFIILSFINFSLWFVVFQNFTSVIIIFLVLFYIKSIRILHLRFGRFLFYYLFLEVVLDLLILLNYFFNIESLFFILFIFKTSVFPFIFYSKIFNNLFFATFSFRVLVTFYFLSFKILTLIFLFSIPLQIISFLSYLFIVLFYFIVYFRFSFISFVFNSFIFSNILFMITGVFFNYLFIIFYTIFVSFFQYKVFNLFSGFKYSICFKDSYFFLMLINGSPLFFFNWFKFYLQSVLLDISPSLSLFQAILSSLFLSYSVYMFIFNKDFNFYNFSPTVCFLFILFLSFFLEFYLLFFKQSQVISHSTDVCFYFILFNSYQFTNLFSGSLSIDFFLIYGENVSVSVSLLFFIFFIVFKSFKFLGVNRTSSFLSNSYNIIFFKSIKSFNYFDSIIFLFPYLLILVSTSNFIFLVENISFLNVSDVMVLVFVLAYQWGWDTGLILSFNFCNYLNFFYVFDIFNYSLDHSIVYFFSFIFLPSGFNFMYFNFLDYFIFFYFLSFFNNIFFNILFLPRRVNIFIQGVSLDVIHAFFIPSLVVKEDLVLDKVFSVFINILELDSDCLEFICFEYCGDFHHSMFGIFYVLDLEIFSLLLIRDEK